MKKVLKTPVVVPSLMDPNFIYVPARLTDIRKTFARFGFVAKNEKA